VIHNLELYSQVRAVHFYIWPIIRRFTYGTEPSLKSLQPLS